MKKVIALLSVILLSTCSFAAEFTPIGSLSVLGGYNSFDSDTSNQMANVNLNLVPSVKFNDDIAVIPSYTFEYRVIKEAQELADGNILFQKGLGNNLYIKPVITISGDTKLSFKVGYLAQELQESSDESLSNGIFNYNKTTVGVDYGNKTYNVGYNLYTVNFPNYTNLIDTTTASQITGNPGNYILDFTAHEFYLMNKFSLSQKVVLDTTLDYTLKMFSQQTVLTDYSVYSSDKRMDNSVLINLFPSFALVPTGPTTISAGLSMNYVFYNSNQGGVDVANSYIANYYSYNEYKIGPTFNFSFNMIPLKASLSYEFGMRNYTDRLAQDVNGNNLTDKAYVDTSYISMNLSYPLMENLNLNFMPSFVTSSSNVKYESFYKYNYNASSIFVGLSYDYK